MASWSDNPYAPAAAVADPMSEESVRRAANAAAVMAGIALVFGALLAPLAVYFGHKALRSIKRTGVGLQHRGAAMVGVVFGWALVLALLLQIPSLIDLALKR